MRIGICDDSQLDREMIRDLLDLYFADKSIAYQVDLYSSGVDVIHEFQEGTAYDIVFLDIYMEKMLGIDVARELRRLHYAGEIVFLTATSDFAVDSYEVQAGGDLLKPHSYEKLCMVMDRVLSACDINTYQIQRRGVVTRIPYHEILYVESRNTRCLLHRKGGGTYTMYKKLGEIEEELYDPRFLRCHQSYLVNMAYVQNADHQFTLFTGDIVLIRQRNLKEIRNRYLDYLKQKTS